MSNNSSVWCFEVPQEWNQYHIWHKIVTSCIGAVANLLILATLLAARISHSCHVYVLVLTLADIGYCITQVLIDHYGKFPQGVMGLWQCRLLSYIHFVSRGLSNWVMVLLAADRLRVVATPLRTHANGRRIWCATVATCVTCLALLVVNLPRLVYLMEHWELVWDKKWLGTVCKPIKTNLIQAQALRGVELTINFHIPVVANAAINIALCICICRAQRLRSQLTQLPSSQQTATNAERQLTQMLVVSSIVHSIFSLPSSWFLIVELDEPISNADFKVVLLCISSFFSFFFNLHPIFNLPIYLVYNSAFRAQFLRLLLPCCQWQSPSK